MCWLNFSYDVIIKDILSIPFDFLMLQCGLYFLSFLSILLILLLFKDDSLFLFLQLVLFGEIVIAQKVMYDKFGDDFLIHFVSHTLLVAHCPQDLAEQYCQKFQVPEALTFMS